jgi:hypothetical protein
MRWTVVQTGFNLSTIKNLKYSFISWHTHCTKQVGEPDFFFLADKIVTTPTSLFDVKEPL